MKAPWVLLMLLLAMGASSGGTPPGGVKLDQPVFLPQTDDLLQYDDGIALWLTWGGLYRGVLFDLADFYQPAPSGFAIQGVEFWFYQHPAYPWDTAQFVAEIWNGDETGPTDLLDQAVLEAAHLSGSDWMVSPPDTVGQTFWIILNTSFSSGGWPSLLGDGTPGTTGSSHSFFSDDRIVWEPWIIGGDTACDYFIRVEGEPLDSSVLESLTWGLVKGSF